MGRVDEILDIARYELFVRTGQLLVWQHNSELNKLELIINKFNDVNKVSNMKVIVPYDEIDHNNNLEDYLFKLALES